MASCWTVVCVTGLPGYAVLLTTCAGGVGPLGRTDHHVHRQLVYEHGGGLYVDALMVHAHEHSPL